jgi:alpha-glucosidase
MTTPWWHHAAIYQVYPRSFRDLDGDGTGDLRGLIAELPYLTDLGVDALWLSPFYPSPQHDSGYDVADPRDVDPRYGTLADARALVEQAHARGLRIIVDLVPNHFSQEHRWFRAALESPPGSAERALFHFRDGRGTDGNEPPTNWVSLFGGPAWTRTTNPDGSPGQWYLHLFDSSQPDLNWSNERVREDYLTTLRFWLDMGVDGFRVDVATGLTKDMSYPDVENPEKLVMSLRLDLDDPDLAPYRLRLANSAFWDRDDLVDVYRSWRQVLDSYSGDRMAVAEANVPPERAGRYVARDALHQIFNFDFLAVPFNAETIVDLVTRTVTNLAEVNAPPTWALSNHDSPRVVSRMGGGGIGLRKARALAVLTHALPGGVYVYQGEELGLPDADLPDEARQDPVFLRSHGEQKGRDGARVPLPWSGDAAPYGFGATADTWLPMPQGWGPLTAQAQEGDPSSTLSLYRELLRLRHVLPALAGSDLTIASDDGVVQLLRGNGFRCVLNTTNRMVDVPTLGSILVGSEPEMRVEGGLLELPPETCAWLQE